MKKIARFLALAILLALTPASAGADPITVTFDSPPCEAHVPGVYPVTCYGGVGVSIWSSRPEGAETGQRMFMIAADPNAVSPPNVARATPLFAVLEAQFRAPTGRFGTSAVSFHIVGSAGAQNPWAVEFYATDDLLERFTGVGDQFISYAPFGGPILGFRFVHGGFSRAIDNLTFNGVEAPAVPEPATMLLVGTGVLALARRRWRMSHAVTR